MKTLSPGFLIISIALVLCLCMPCYAQIETQRFFTPEGTRWKLNELCHFESTSCLITEIGFFSGNIWLWDDNSDRYFVCGNFYKMNRLISKFSGGVSFSEWWFDGISASGYVISFLKSGKLHLEHLYVCPPWGSAYIITPMSIYPLPTCSEGCDTTITKIDDNFSPEP